MPINDTLLDGLRLLQLENEWLSLSILPEVGAKILTLLDKKSNRNLLCRNPRIRPQAYPIDANFDNYWCGGWDDAYPTADACVMEASLFRTLESCGPCVGRSKHSRQMSQRPRQDLLPLVRSARSRQPRPSH